MALSCGHLKIEDLEPEHCQWQSGPLGFAGWYEPPPAPHPAFQHLAVNSCPDNQIPPMIEPHIRQIMLECSPELQVVEVNVPPGFRSEDSWKTCLRETAAGTIIEALTREDRRLAKEIGKAMIEDCDYKWYWSNSDSWNKEYEEKFKLELESLDESEETYVLVPNDKWGDEDFDDCSPRPEEAAAKALGIDPEVQRTMLHCDLAKDEEDEDMMKEMARFESETNLHLLRTTPPEDRIFQFTGNGQYEPNDYWLRVDESMNFRSNLETLYLKERIKCEAVVIRKPTNRKGYALAVCDYGLVHIANKFLSHVPEIDQTVQLTITVADIEEKKPFPLTTVYIH